MIQNTEKFVMQVLIKFDKWHSQPLSQTHDQVRSFL